MNRKWILAGLAVLLAMPSPALAQRGDARTLVAPKVARALSFAFNRGRIGVLVKMDADSATDRIGARIDGVTEGGPAEKAGLKVGDIITRFNGVSLARATSEDEHRSGPGEKLVRLAQALDPGDTVRVEYKRGNETRTATLVAQDIDQSWNLTTPLPRADVMVGPEMKWHLDEDDPGFTFAFGHPWGNLELVRLNPDLGEYFGTQEGLLVVRAPTDGELSLKGGDVILTIDARKPTSPAHAMRILRSYDVGESVKIEVMRKRQRVTVTWAVPRREDMLRPKRRAPEGEGGVMRIMTKRGPQSRRT